MLSVRERGTGRDLFAIFGLMPVPGDCHLCEYVPYTADPRERTWERYDIQFYDMQWGRGRRQAGLKRVQEVLAGRERIETPCPITSERAEILIDAIANNRHQYEEALNIPNRGYIPNLPEGSIVEVPGLVGSDGPTGRVVGNLPEAIAALCRRQISINELTVQAFQTGDRRLVHQLFAIDPMIQDPAVAVKLADAYLDLYSEYLPTFD